ncbi:MAG TPA: shikimate dehydrogenase [Rhodanobacteraceae bacterium]
MSSAITRFAVFGHPIAHSLSPAIHAAFAAQFDIDLTYVTIDAAPDAFADAVQAFFRDGGAGANVTLPHKRAALELAASATVAATRAGTANVLTPRADGLEAHNTDGAGLVRDLVERHHATLRDGRVLLLGAGGAAHGVAGPLLDARIAQLTVVNRTCARAQELVDHLDDSTRAVARDWDALASLGPFDLIVNATSAGVHRQVLTLPAHLANAGTLGYDLSYGPAATPFVTWAQAAGARHALDGLGMLLETAADAFELWHGKRPDTDPVYQKLRG